MDSDAALQHATVSDYLQKSCDTDKAQGSSEETINSRVNAAKEDSLKRLFVLYEQQAKRIKAAAVELPEEAEVLVVTTRANREKAHE